MAPHLPSGMDQMEWVLLNLECLIVAFVHVVDSKLGKQWSLFQVFSEMEAFTAILALALQKSCEG